MKPCPKCRFELEDDATECPACGIVIEKYLAFGTGQVPITRDTEELPPPPPADHIYDPGDVPAPAENPYAPPVATVAPPSAPAGEAVASADVITRLTVESLLAARPWVRFLAIYSMVVMVFLVLGALVSLVAAPAGEAAGLMLFLFYVFYGLIVLSLLLPLSASAKALKGLGTHQTSAALEEFAVQQTKFWRRTGIMAAVGVVLMILMILLGVLGAGLSIFS